jgi:NCAIR mutase (PurE)-related protein
MDREKVRALLEEVAAGALAPEQALARLRTLPYEDLRFARVDLHRSLRHGVPEAVYCAGKTPEQVVAIVERLAQHHDNVLATRAEPAVAAALARGRAPGRGEAHRARRGGAHRGGERGHLGPPGGRGGGGDRGGDGQRR